MKLNKLYIACGALFFGTVALTGCSDDESYDVDGSASNVVYVDPAASNVTECTVYHTPIGSFGNIKANVSAKLQYPSDDAITVSATPDVTLLDTYNATYNKEALNVPDEVLEAIEVVPTGIEPGKVKASGPVEITLPASVCTQLTETDYVIPMRLTAVKETNEDNSRPVEESQEMGIAYIAIHTTGDIVAVRGNNTATCAIVRTPVGMFGGVSATFTGELPFAMESDIKVTAVFDNSLFDDFNNANGGSFKQVPANVANALTITTGTIQAGQTSAQFKVSVPDNVRESFVDPAYLIPMHLVAEYSNGTKVDLEQAAYVKVYCKEDHVQDNPNSAEGALVTDISAWTCISAVNYNENELKLDGWRPSVIRVSEASFVVNMGSVQQVTGFRSVDNYVQNSYRIYLSEDNVKWTDLGDTNGKSKYQNCYQLYGAVPARYVKVEQTFNPNNWAWDWGYIDTDWGIAVKK